ncbi:MAG: DNA-binding response regulator [Halobacteriovorax sp.]|nr:DNA-binding response regulator [Halobacteriovorax sp.]|tara:strand:+ start:92363 stop:93052 length:690 start_codon:yes stop_codon:yes gene_type:complete
MTKAKILIVEDEEDIRDLIHFHLFKSKHQVYEADNGPKAVEEAISKKPDLILLDIMIPGIDGIEVCRQLKANSETKDIKIIFISAKGEEEDIVKGLELGADDYISKPFSPKILIARVNAVLRRDASPEESKTIEYAGIKVDLNKRKVSIDESEINLTLTEFQVLSYLIATPGHVYTRTQIVNKIRGHNHAVTDRSVDTQLVSLRKKLGEKGQLIETVWGVGYKFREDET